MSGASNTSGPSDLYYREYSTPDGPVRLSQDEWERLVDYFRGMKNERDHRRREQ